MSVYQDIHKAFVILVYTHHTRVNVVYLFFLHEERVNKFSSTKKSI